MPVDNVTACQSWSYFTLSDGHFYFWAKNPSPDIFRTHTPHLDSHTCKHIYMYGTCTPHRDSLIDSSDPQYSRWYYVCMLFERFYVPNWLYPCICKMLYICMGLYGFYLYQVGVERGRRRVPPAPR